MATRLNPDEWAEILENKKLTNPLDFDILNLLFETDGYKAAASQISDILGCKHYGILNLEIGRYAKRIAKSYPVKFKFDKDRKRYSYWDFFFKGRYDGELFVWTLKTEIIDAFNKLTKR